MTSIPSPRQLACYKAAAGLAIETLNRAPPTIPNGARVRALQAT